MGHLKDAKEAWCKICTGSAVEDARHYMCQCPNDLYVQVFVFVFHYAIAQEAYRVLNAGRLKLT